MKPVIRASLAVLLLALPAGAYPAKPKDLELAATPASPAGTFRGRQIKVSHIDEIEKFFAVAHPTRFVFAARDLDLSRSKVGFQTRTIKKGEVMLVAEAYDSWVVAQTIDDQYIKVDANDISLDPVRGAALVPLTPGDLPVHYSPPSGDPTWLSNAPVTDSGLNYGETPVFYSMLKADDPRRETLVASREKTVACYDAQMKKLDPQGKRKNFLQETHNVKTGQTTRIESLSAVFDRKACGPCKCKTHNAREAAVLRELLLPLQTEKLASLSSTIERVTSLFPN